MGRLELVVMAGPESKSFLADLTAQLDRLEKLASATVGTAPKKNTAAVTDEDEDTTASDDDDDEFSTPAKKAVKTATAKKAAAAFEDDDEETEAEEDEDFTEPAPKKAKAKKITLDAVNDACKERAKRTGGKKGREEVLTILRKKFKTESVSDLEETQYAAAIAAMEVE